MLAETASVLALLAPAATALPAPAATATTAATLGSRTWVAPAVTHTVVAGLGGLRLHPDNIVAQIGDYIEWHFLPANHPVVQSSFDAPCQPLATGGGFYSGFEPASMADGQAADVFQILVKNTEPIWYYSAQQAGDECQAGMAGVINQDYASGHTLRAYKDAAALSGVSGIPPYVQGGYILANPHPLAGY